MQAYFRDAVPGDLPAIRAIIAGIGSASSAANDDTPPVGSFRDTLIEIDRTDGNYVLVAEYDSQIVAVLQMLAFRQLQDRGGRTALIAMLRVAEAFRTSGVDGMLVDHATRRAVDLGCRRIELMCRTSDTDQHTFWERAGFIHLDRGYVRDLSDARRA